MKKSISHAFLGLALASMAWSANAGLSTSVSSGPYSAKPGVVNFDFGTGGTSETGPVVANFSTTFDVAKFTGGQLFNMTATGISGVSARPVNSDGNYWSLQGGQTGTVTFDTPLSYYGFLWGSPDTSG